MKHFSTCILFGLLALPGSPALAQPVGALPPVSAITFTPGSTASTVNGQMAPGGRDLYYVLAKAGQTLLVSVTADADVTFQVYTPDTTLAKAADGKPLIEGKTLSGAGASDNAKAWVGAVPRDGNYLIAVGTGGGGAATAAPSPYGLTVSLQ